MSNGGIHDEGDFMERWKQVSAERDVSVKLAVAYRLLLIDICRPNTIPQFEAAVAQARNVIETELKHSGHTWEQMSGANPEILDWLIGDINGASVHKG